MRILLSILILILSQYCSVVVSQEKPVNTSSLQVKADTTVASSYLNKSKEFLAQMAVDSALFYTQKAQDVFKKAAEQDNSNPIWKRYIQVGFTVGDMLRDKGDYKNARTHLEALLKTAQQQFGEIHELTANCFKKIGIVYHYQDNLAQALEFYQKSLAIFLQASGNNEVEVANVYENMAIVSEQKGELDEALKLYQKALTIRQKILPDEHPDIARSFANFGNVYLYKGDFDKAIEYHNKALKIFINAFGENHPLVASSYNNVGVAYDEKGNYDRAIENISKALEIYRQIYGDNYINVAVIYGNLAERYNDKGDYDLALEYNNRSLRILLENVGEEHHFVASCYNIMGTIYSSKKEYEQAVQYLQKALAINRKVFGDQALEVANNYHALGGVYAEKGDFDEAIKSYADEKNTLITSFGELHPQLVPNYTKTGTVYFAMQDFKQAGRFYDKALALARETIGEKHPETADIYLDFGDVLLKQHRLKQAVGYYQKALISLVSDFNDTSITANPALKNISSETGLLRALSSKAAALSLSGGSADAAKIRQLQTALATFQLASEMIDRLRTSYRVEESKLSLTTKSQHLFEQAIQASLSLYRLTQNETYKQQAFFFAEKGKAAVLSEVLQANRALKYTGIPDSLLAKEKNLRLDLAFYETEIQKEKNKKQERDTLKIADFQNRHFQLRVESEKQTAELEKNYPDFYNLKYQTNTASVGDIQNRLNKNTGLLEYFVGDSAIFIFTISADAFTITPLQKDATFAKNATDFYRAIKKVDAAAYTTSAVQLYDLIVAPVEKHISALEKLVIIPDGVLYYIPFEALLTTANLPDKRNFSQFPYFIKQHEITYHYSATLLTYDAHPDRHNLPNASFAGFAPVFSDQNAAIPLDFRSTTETAQNETDPLRSVTIEGQSFRSLPYSRDEVAAILKLFVDSHFQGQAFFDQEASEDNFKRGINGARFVHIATHGIMNEEQPKLTGLIFSQPKDSTAGEDGILYAGETFNLDLNADLVVLSSCESGLGQLVKGEGLMALTRGFIYSGADNIVVSLWKVLDAQTSVLMVEFYKQILSGQSYSRALRLAKLKMIANNKSAFPQKWSGFVLIGD